MSLLFHKLLQAFPQIRFRLGSLEPMEATMSLIELIRDFPNACKHLHLPLQSGDDGILEAMNRPYRSSDYREKIKQIRALIPDIAITTDILVGFPGESEEAHRRSLAFAEEMAFSRTHVFAYSRRTGTKAADLPDHLAKGTKDRRSAEFIRLGHAMQNRYGESWVGRQQQVLLEEQIAGIWYGHGDNYMEVTCEDPSPCTKGQILTLTITGASPHKPGAWSGELRYKQHK